jgi:hypothetical protein
VARAVADYRTLMHDEELHNLFSSPNIITMMTLREMAPGI